VPAWGWALLFSVLLCLPRLGSFGLWEPWELNVADHARQLAAEGTGPSALFTAIAHAQLGPYFQALGIALLGPSETGARLFGALAGVGGLMAVFWGGAGLFRGRAALLSVLALGTTPLYALSARQATSHIPLVAALALVLGALGRWGWPPTGKRRWRDLAIASCGLLLAFGAGGALVGVAVPCLSLVFTVLVCWGLRAQAPEADTPTGAAEASPRSGADAPNDGTDELATWGVGPDIQAGQPLGASFRRHPLALEALIAIGVLGLGLVVACLGKVGAGKPSVLLGGVPRAGTPSITFEYLIRQLGFGLFPWSAVAFFALGRPLIRLDDDEDGARTNRRLAFSQTYLLLFAGMGFVLGAVQALFLGEARYAALAAIALAVGAFLDEALEGNRAEPVAGLLMATGTMIVARDFFLLPEDLVSVHLLGEKVKWPAVVSIGHLMLAFGLLVAAGVYVGLAMRGRALGKAPPPAELASAGRWRRGADRLFVLMGRYGLQAGVGAAVLFVFWLTQGLVPTLSSHFSFKPVMESFSKYARSGERFGRYRIEGKGTSFYTRTTMIDLASQDKVVAFLHSPDRVFALVSADELAALDAAFKTAAVPYFAVDASSSRFLLLSNRLAQGESDDNPLRKNVWTAPTNPATHGGQWNPAEHPPWSWRVPFSATFGDSVEIVGADFPATIRRPTNLKLELFFRAKARPPGNYKIFVHLDGPAAPRVIGDHDPVAKAFPTSNWLPGEYIRDSYDIELPLMTTPAGTYRIFFGFWPGGEGKRLPITSGPNDGNDRVPLGTIEIK
jgi:Dolichyl-phosphate-mannose-protein mannosyltransferase